MAPWAVRVEGGFGRYRWFVYIIKLLLREASWLLYCIVGHPNRLSAIYIVSAVETSLRTATFWLSCNQEQWPKLDFQNSLAFIYCLNQQPRPGMVRVPVQCTSHIQTRPIVCLVIQWNPSCKVTPFAPKR